MCSNYVAVTDTERLRLHFGIQAPPPRIKSEVWPLYEAPFIRRHPHKDVGDDAVPPREGMAGLFGMIPHWAGDLAFGRRTYNARSETVAEKPSFRDAWRNAQHCIIPVECIYEPDWRTGRAIPTRIQRKDGRPMGIAGLWTSNRKATGEEVFSFTMLTVNADEHELFKLFHRPQDEKRMVVILREDQYDDWLDASAAQSMNFMRQFPAHLLIATPEPERGKRKRTDDSS
jgi:putative SOS response-associated peptidase YedK